MSTEYVRITPPEQVFGETNLLQSEVSLLTMMQQYHEYAILRKEELYLKIELKKKISEMAEFLDSMAKILPESKFEQEQAEKERLRREMIDKIESSVQKANKAEWRYWKETEPKVRKVKEVAPKTEKETPKTPIEKELEDIQKRLAKLQ